jgi:predicted nuclease of predicted toxin-antitoxin system
VASAAGHDVLDARELHTDPGDAALLALAARERRILVTVDQDFGALIFQERRPRSGLVRLPNGRVAARIAIVADLLATHRTQLESAAVITVSEGRVRVSYAS